VLQGFVIESIFALLAALRVFFRSRGDAALEILALRQQVAVLKRKRPRPNLSAADRLFWTFLRGRWPRWADVLLIVKPETVVRWHRAGFRLYWRWRSRPGGGRPRITDEIRTLIRRVADEDPDWGAPKIHGELQKLGFLVSERSVSRYLRRIQRRGDPGKRWLAFLQNHREVIVAFDFFTVPTVTFQVLYCFFVIEHGRRKILHFNVTRHPTSEWVVQQLREAFPEATPYRHVILDRDAKFDTDVIAFLKATGLKPSRTSVRAPWQNGIAERWVGGCRREMLDHVIPLNEQHLRRLVRDYVSYFHDDRIHDSLGKDTPNRRPVEPKPAANATVIS
jgi:transposase InsO family protein